VQLRELSHHGPRDVTVQREWLVSFRRCLGTPLAPVAASRSSVAATQIEEFQMAITKATQNVPTHIQVRCVREHQGTRPGEGTTVARSREGADQEPTILGKSSTGLFEQFRALFEALPDAMVVVDQTGTIVLVNTQMERLFGYERDEPLGKPVDILVPERLRNSHRGHRASYFLAPTVRPMGSATDLPAARKDGQEFPVEISLSPVETSSGALVICAIRDVTVQRTTQQAAEQANHLKDEFLATVSHEFRTPLNAVLGWARLLGSTQLPPERAKHAIAAIGRSASALAHMVDDLLDTSRILEGTIRLALEPVDLVNVAQAALEAVRPLVASGNVQLTFDTAPGHRTVSGDAGRLQQVIGNLLANAIKFTPEGGRVGVFIEPSTDHVEIRIVDTGQGISPDLLPHVFERFRQASHATTERHTGLGLGLSTVRELVKLHGGTVHAASPGPGHGATFTVRLPVAAGDAAGQRVAPAERRTGSSTTSPAPRLPRLDGLRILVVDDHADGRLLTSLVLTQAGASVKVVASSREALHVLDVDRPDALVSDIDLSGEDGYALIRQIRQHEAAHGGFLPAIALTGYARAEDRARTLAAGFQVHAPKPIEPAMLTAAIAALTRHPGTTNPNVGSATDRAQSAGPHRDHSRWP
jgi:PAS domain S-box-containing protein